ncbi:MAG: hypothetical protein AAF203_09075, partial [Pseudomonadota bacterium]
MKTATHQKFFSILQEVFPKSASEILSAEMIRDQLLSPFQLKLEKKVLEQVRSFVTKCYEIRDQKNYQEQLQISPDWVATPAILSCFDFHYSPAMGLKLIEVNTNASLYVTSHLLYLCQELSVPDPQLEKLHRSFQQSFDFEAHNHCFIMDRQPNQEGLYFEFLLFKEWLESKG